VTEIERFFERATG